MIEELDINNDEQFYKRLDHLMRKHKLTATEISHSIGANCRGWLSRRTIPHPFVRPIVFKCIDQFIKDKSQSK